MATSALPTRVAWPAATDPSSPINGYEVQVSVNGGAWANTLATTSAQREVVYPLAFDTTYKFRVRALDTAGNWGTWVESAITTRVHPYDDRSSSVVRSSGWTLQFQFIGAYEDDHRLVAVLGQDQAHLHRPPGGSRRPEEPAARQGQGLHRRRLHHDDQHEVLELPRPSDRLHAGLPGGRHAQDHAAVDRDGPAIRCSGLMRSSSPSRPLQGARLRECAMVTVLTPRTG